MRKKKKPNFFKKLYNKVYDWCNPFKRNLEINKHIYYHYSDWKDDDYNEYRLDMRRLNNLKITDVLSREEKDRWVVWIHLQRPGLLIGRAGQDLDKLEKSLKTKMGKTVKVLIKEEELWMFNKY